jgi:glycosyltransferase A (GT-A) superfamily protein (DUF2064 family)
MRRTLRCAMPLRPAVPCWPSRAPATWASACTARWRDSLALHSRALLMGTDAPALDAAVLRQAAAALIDHDVVFVPALDGGYALVGQRRADPRWFHGMTWSHPG